MLADAASPVALFTIGAVLARSALLAREHRASARWPRPWAAGRRAPAQAPTADVLPVAAIKLLAHPAAGLRRRRAPRWRWACRWSAVALVAIVLVAALPSASNVAMLAERFGADSGRIARIILWTTVAAFFSFPLAVGWVR